MHRASIAPRDRVSRDYDGALPKTDGILSDRAFRAGMKLIARNHGPIMSGAL